MKSGKEKKKLVVIGGLTGSGKTSLAVDMAKELDGELVNADSRQIYKYLNIGTNKGTIEHNNSNTFLNGKRIHLVDITDPNDRFNLYQFQKLAFETIENIISNGKIPILVGGTGLYIDSIIKNYKLDPNTNHNRNDLGNLTTGELQKILSSKIDTTLLSQNKSEWNNKRRLIRFIEKSSLERKKNEPIYDYLMLYPDYRWEDLKVKIENRVLEMFKEGFIDEVKSLLEMEYSKESPALKIMGYSHIISFLNNEISLEKTIQEIQYSHKQYARRQRTWFEGQKRGYELNKINSVSEAINLTKQFLE